MTAKNKSPYIIGISGASGSGKTYLTTKIAQELGSKAIIISQDSYYKKQSHIAMEQRIHTNYDHPDAIDSTMLIEHLEQLKKGSVVQCPVYDFSIHDRTQDCVTVEPTDYIILDGILLFAIPDLCNMIDFKLFVDTPLDICFIRRLQRDIKERGRTTESVVEQYLETVRPMSIEYILPSKKYADLNVYAEILTDEEIDKIILKIKKYYE